MSPVSIQSPAILFLAIDGVLWAPQAEREFTPHHLPHPEAMENLRDFCESKGMRIVVNSSWLGGASGPERTRQFMRDAGLEPFLHEDWHTEFCRGMEEREGAIRQWLDSHEVLEWLVIDDAPLALAPEDRERQVRTDIREGFTREKQREAGRRLAQLAEAHFPHLRGRVGSVKKCHELRHGFIEFSGLMLAVTRDVITAPNLSEGERMHRQAFSEKWLETYAEIIGFLQCVGAMLEDTEKNPQGDFPAELIEEINRRSENIVEKIPEVEKAFEKLAHVSKAARIKFEKACSDLFFEIGGNEYGR